MIKAKMEIWPGQPVISTYFLERIEIEGKRELVFYIGWVVKVYF